MYYFERQLKIFASIFLLIACLATGLIAQDISGTIGGTILDPSGATVPNAKVTITNTDRNQVVRTITTDAIGHLLGALDSGRANTPSRSKSTVSRPRRAPASS